MMAEPQPAGLARVLVVDAQLPMPDRDGGSLRLFSILTLLVELGHPVTFVPAHPSAQPETSAGIHPYVEQLRAAGIQVITAPRIQTLHQHLEAHGQGYAVVLLTGGVYNAYEHYGDVRRLAPQASLWFDTLDLAHLREYRRARLFGSQAVLLRALEAKRRELLLASQADWTLVVSPHEAAILQRAAPRTRVHVLTNIHQVHGSAAPFEARSGIVFIGAYQHQPNVDGIQWFVEHVFPLLRAALPGVRLTLVGAHPPSGILALATPDVHIAGHVPDLGPVYNTCRLSIAPLRFGAGVKGKVLLSLGYGVPVVGTTLAAEGSYLVDGLNIRLADDPAGFAQAVIDVYTQPALWRHLSTNGLDTVARHFSRDNARRQLQHLLAASLPAPLQAELAGSLP